MQYKVAAKQTAKSTHDETASHKLHQHCDAKKIGGMVRVGRWGARKKARKREGGRKRERERDNSASWHPFQA